MSLPFAENAMRQAIEAPSPIARNVPIIIHSESAGVTVIGRKYPACDIWIVRSKGYCSEIALLIIGPHPITFDLISAINSSIDMIFAPAI